MKIFTNRIFKTINNTVNKARNLKTEPYPLDSFQITQKFEPQVSSWQKLRNIFGLRTKLNPKSFADGSHTPRGPYVNSRQAVNLSEEYLRNNCLMEDQRIVDGFRDAGGGAFFNHWGDVIRAKREVITIDKKSDVYLRNAICYVRQNTSQLSEKKKVKFIYNLIQDISGNAEKAVERSKILGESAVGEECLLGKIFEHGAAVCRHKAIMFKILAEEVGIKTRILRGNAVDLGGFGRHVWNEVKLKDGGKFLVDTQNSRMVDLYAKNAYKNPELASYCNENNIPIYYKFKN